MPGLNKLANQIKELDELCHLCTKCGMCQSVCPLFGVTGREPDVARGKLALLDGLMEEMFSNPSGVSQRLDKCLLCGSCESKCPRGVKHTEIYLKARNILTEFLGLTLIRKLVLRKIVANPAVFNRLAFKGAKYQKLLLKSGKNITGTSCARSFSPIFKGRHIKSPARVPFHKKVPGLNTSPGKSGLKVGLFTGCIFDKVFPETMESALVALKHHDTGVYLPEKQGCCGIPSLSYGDMESFTDLVVSNINAFKKENFDYLITCCATCTSVIKNVWPVMCREIDQNLYEEVSEISEKTMDISEFLCKNFEVEDKSKPSANEDIKVTYHDPCHLKNSLGVTEEPRKLIKSSGGYKLEEMQKSVCCGMGGSFNLKHYDISAQIGQKNRNETEKSGASVIATSCPACMMQFCDMSAKSENPVKVMHVIDIYSQSLGNV